MPNPFRVGDTVLYDSECEDHDQNDEGLTVGDYYTVSEIHTFGAQECVYLKEVGWWVDYHCCSYDDGSRVPMTTQDRVNRKIKKMYERRGNPCLTLG